MSLCVCVCVLRVNVLGHVLLMRLASNDNNPIKGQERDKILQLNFIGWAGSMRETKYVIFFYDCHYVKLPASNYYRQLSLICIVRVVGLMQFDLHSLHGEEERGKSVTALHCVGKMRVKVSQLEPKNFERIVIRSGAYLMRRSSGSFARRQRTRSTYSTC